METLYIILGIYWVIAIICELNSATRQQFKETYKSFKDVQMPFYAAFWFLLVVGFILFVPFTFPRSLWIKCRDKIRSRRAKKEAALGRRDPSLMAGRIIDTLKKRSTISAWPVITIESNKGELWNKLNTINEYVFFLITKHYEEKDKLNFEIKELKDELAARGSQKKPLDPPVFEIPKFDPIANPEPIKDIFVKAQQRPITEVFDARICNLIKKYEQTYGGIFMIIKDLAKMSRSDLKLLRGVGSDTVNIIESKLLKRKITMKP